MKYINIRELKEKIYFTTYEIAEYLGIKKESARVLCSRYSKKGLIIRLKRDLYILREKWETLSIEEYFNIANMLQVPSYISLMTGLYYHQITTQVQRRFYESISLKRSIYFSIEQTEFHYHKINRKFYFGFFKKDKIFIAEKEKAFVDTLYLTSLGKYKFDVSSVDLRKLKKNKIEKILKIYPEKTNKIFIKIWKS